MKFDPEYVSCVLNDIFEDAKAQFLTPLMEIHRAHLVMLAGQGIVPPKFLARYRPDAVIVMNAIYRDEIRRELTDLNVSAEVLSA